MPSQRRIKVLGLVVLLSVLTFFYFTSAARQTRDSEFYRRTSTALQQKEETARAEQEAADAARLSEDVGKRLKEAEEQAKKSADAKGRKMAQEVMGHGLEADASEETPASDGGKSVAGRYRMKDESDEPLGVAKVGGNVGEKDRKGKLDEDETDEEHEVEVELNSILKKSPIIIFSKTYCRFSRKAKRILLETYNITPPPYVVELDIHPLGPALQASLAKKTNRRTVPNILVNGLSIGGGDDIESLHLNGKLEETLRDKGGKRIMEVRLVEDEDDEKTEIKRDDAKKASGRRRGR